MIMDRIRSVLGGNRRNRSCSDRLEHCKNCAADCPYINGCT